MLAYPRWHRARDDGIYFAVMIVSRWSSTFMRHGLQCCLDLFIVYVGLRWFIVVILVRRGMENLLRKIHHLQVRAADGVWHGLFDYCCLFSLGWSSIEPNI